MIFILCGVNKDSTHYTGLSRGTHTISFFVQDDEEAWSIPAERSLIVHERPVTFIDSITPNPALAWEEVLLEGHGTDDGSIMEFKWSSSINGLLYSGAEEDVTIDFLVPGNHTLYYYATDDLGAASYASSMNLTVHERPEARIDSITPNPAATDDSIVYDWNGTDDGTIEDYLWRIEDDTNAEIYSGKSPPGHLDKGNYNVFLRVMDNNGIWSEEVREPLLVHYRPTANIISLAPDVAVHNTEIHFTGNGSDTDGTVVNYSWSSSLDGSFYVGPETSYSKADLSKGEHTIEFRVQDSDGGWSHPAKRQLIIHERPVASIVNIHPDPGLNSESIMFSGNGEDDGSILRYIWASDVDGIIYNGSESEVDISNLSLGFHTITFMTQDNHGALSAADTNRIRIHERPVAYIDYVSKSKVFKGESVEFEGDGDDDGTIVGYRWTSSIDGEIYNGTEWNFTISNLSVGKHNITLQVQDNHGVWSFGNYTKVKVEEKNMFLLEPVGPLPLMAYIVMIAVVISVVGISKRKGMKKKSSRPTGSLGSTPPSPHDVQRSYLQQPQQPFLQHEQPSNQSPPPPQQFPPSTQQAVIQPFIPYPQAGTMQQSGQTPSPAFAQYPVQDQSRTQPSAIPQQQSLPPKQPPGISTEWFCSKCGNTVDGKYAFCLNCGQRRSS